MKNYDVIIIGAGPSGIFCAYELIHAKKDLKVLMIEKEDGLRTVNVRSVRPRCAWGVSRVPSRPDSPVRELSPMASCPYRRMSAVTCRRF